jgi:hypothetical protein
LVGQCAFRRSASLLLAHDLVRKPQQHFSGSCAREANLSWLGGEQDSGAKNAPRERDCFSPPPAREARGGEGHRRPSAAVVQSKYADAKHRLWVGASYCKCARTPHPGSHRHAMFTDPPHRKRGEGKEGRDDSFRLARNTPPRRGRSGEACAHRGRARRASVASFTANSVEGSSALAITLRQCRWRRPHFDLVLREFVAQRHRCSQRFHKAFVRRLNVSIKLHDKEFVLENMKTIVIAHGRLQAFRDIHPRRPTTRPATLMLR